MNKYNKNHGLILHIDKTDQIYTILDQTEGKICCKSKQKNNTHFPGLFIDYFLYPERRFFKINEIEVHDSIKNINLKKLNFFHQLLEINYYFLPENLSSPEIFEFLKTILLNSQFYSKFHQKIITCKLFTIMGVVPEHSFKQAYLNLIISFPIDTLIELELNLDMEKYLNKWIIEGIKSHSNTQKFQTMRFFEF